MDGYSCLYFSIATVILPIEYVEVHQMTAVKRFFFSTGSREFSVKRTCTENYVAELRFSLLSTTITRVFGLLAKSKP